MFLGRTKTFWWLVIYIGYKRPYIVETVTDFILGGAPESLQMVTAAMKLKDACSFEEKL